MDKYITVKGKKDRLQIILDDQIEFEKLKEKLRLKLLPMKALLKKADTAIEFINRELTSEEENELIEVIKKNTDITITMVFSKNVYSHDKDLTQKIISNSIALEGNTKFHRGNLRAGRKLEFDGNLVILGDVNPGAEVTASGNIIVIGRLSGSVTAGSKDKDNSFVGAVFMNPVHLIIGDVFSKPLQNEILETNKINKKNKFKLAFLKNNEIKIEDFDIRSFL